MHRYGCGVLAEPATIPVDMAFAGHTPNDAHAVQFLATLRCLANGFIVTSLLWAAALAALLDGQLIRAAIYNIVAGICALFGIIHSPLNPAAIALPQDVLSRLPQPPGYQTPYHWTAAYGLTGLMLLCLALFRTPPAAEREETRSPH